MTNNPDLCTVQRSSTRKEDMSFDSHPPEPTAAEMRATIDRLTALVDAQQEALEALDVLWRAQLVREATDKVIIACEDTQTPTEDDQMMVDVWKHPDITRRIVGQL